MNIRRAFLILSGLSIVAAIGLLSASGLSGPRKAEEPTGSVAPVANAIAGAHRADKVARRRASNPVGEKIPRGSLRHLRDGRVAVTGKLRVVHGDDFKHGRSVDDFYLLRRGERPLHLRQRKQRVDRSVRYVSISRVARGPVESRQLEGLAESTVKATGELDDGTLVAGSVKLISRPSPRAHASVSGARKVAVLPINFADDRSEPWTTAELRGYIFTDARSVNSFYQEDSSGQLSLAGKTLPTGDVFDWIELDANGAPCNEQGWADEANLKAQMAGIDLTGYDNFIYVFPHTSCPFGGRADLGGSRSWNNGQGSNPPTYAHELGHNFGLLHANRLRCTVGGHKVSLAATGCSSIDVGDPGSVMGESSFLNHNIHKIALGFLPQSKVTMVTGYGDYAISAAEDPLNGGPTQDLRIPRSYDSTNPYYDLEFRQSFGHFDNFGPSDPLSTGVAIRLADTVGLLGPNSPAILDMTPETDTFTDAPLVVGKSFYDPLGNFTITTLSAGPTGANIRYAAGPPPGGPVTAQVSGGVLNVSAGAGRSNDIAISRSGDIYIVSDNAGQVVPGAGCTAVVGNVVNCSATGVKSLFVDGNDGDDRLATLVSTPGVLSGGDGNDVLTGGPGPDTLLGGIGSDQLYGGGDVVNTGDDTIDGGTGADSMYGYDGVDMASYAGRANPVFVTQDTTANDGEAGESDIVSTDIENVVGGDGNDVLVMASGCPCEASIDNQLQGGAGTDQLVGGDGSDDLNGGSGTDTLDGGTGSDALGSSDGGQADHDICGAQNDSVKADTADTVDLDCEQIDLTPETSIDSGPSTLTNDGTPTFTFSSPDASASFECSVDNAAFSSCSSPFTPSLADGGHTFQVRAKVGSQVDVTPASRSFVVDTVAPDTAIDSAAPSYDSTPAFAFSSADSTATFECKIDAASFEACSSPYTAPRLSDAGHTFQVRARDAADNVDSTPATQGFTIAAHALKVAAGVLSYTANDGQANNVAIAVTGSVYTVTDAGATINSVGAGCTSVTANQATCSVSGVASIFVDSADLGDSVTVNGANAGVGAKIEGGPGNDILNGGDGDDTIDGGLGSDLMEGNGGTDTVTYVDRTNPVIVAAYNSVSDDGEASEGDHVMSDTENLVGGSGDDTFTMGYGCNGCSLVNNLQGGSGNDTLNGAFGDDVIIGGFGNDTLNGEDGNDTLDGTVGNDVLNGAAGADTLNTRDGAVDTANCGSEVDSVFADAIDTVASDCELDDAPGQLVQPTSPATPPVTVNLTTEGTSDWTHWGTSTPSLMPDRKTGANLISSAATIGTGAVTRTTTSGPTAVWSDGTPTASATTMTGIGTGGASGRGFRVMLPVSSAKARTLKLYVGVLRGSSLTTMNGTLKAYLSDGSAPTMNGPTISNSSSSVATNRMFTISARSAQPGATLTVEWTQTSSTSTGSARLYSATLADNSDIAAPDTTITAGPTDGAIVTQPTASFSFTSTESGSTFQCKVDSASYSTCSSPTTTPVLVDGLHTFKVRAIDSAGNIDPSPGTRSFYTATPVSTLTVTQATGPTSISLSTEGTTDWAHWGTSTSSLSPDHKSGITRQIFPAVTVSTGSAGGSTRITSSVPVASWTGGTPTSSSAGSTTAVTRGGASGRGFQITMPVTSTNMRTVKFYVGSTDTQGKLELNLGDGSPTVTTTLAKGPTGVTTNVVFTVKFRASKAGSLLVKWTQDSTATNGNINLQSATLVQDADGTQPDTTIDSGPADGSTISGNKATFGFSSTEGGSSFQCKLDTAAFVSCISPYTTPTLTSGPHIFDVRAIDPAGNADPTPARRTFYVS